MTIAAVRTHRLTTGLHTPFVTALRRTSLLETVVVEVVDSEGHRGFGEAPQVWRVTGESLASAEACLTGPLTDAVRDRCPDDLYDLTTRVSEAVVDNFGAKAAMDVALHDLAARRMRVPLTRLLGTSSSQVQTDVTLSAGTTEALVDAAMARVDEGFSVLKLKVGLDPEGDVATVRAVREAVGPEPRIRLDANQAWTVRQAITVIRSLEDADLDLEFVEQPVARHDRKGLARVTASVDLPIMADESVFGLRDLSEVIELGAADLINIKLAKCGGLTTARAMIDLARAHGIGYIVGSMMEGPIGVGAAASLVAAAGSTLTSDLDAAWWVATSPVVGGIVYEGPTVVIPSDAGLGVEGLF
jgi:L-alanine-DL-glutamate epimerase-like enolase superfamily enzyme